MMDPGVVGELSRKWFQD